MGTLHIYRADNKRVRRICPYHKHLCYANYHEYYDGYYIFFDCGTKIDSDGWTPPPKKKCQYCRKWFRPFDIPNHLREYHRIGV